LSIDHLRNPGNSIEIEENQILLLMPIKMMTRKLKARWAMAKMKLSQITDSVLHQATGLIIAIKQTNTGCKLNQ